MRYEVGKNVIHDLQTNLYWEVNSSLELMTWQEFSEEHINKLNERKFGGYEDWRVPSKDELRSLVNYNSIDPAFEQSIFKTMVGNDYWCGNGYGPREDCAWVINMNIGAATAKNKTLTSYAVAVRGEKVEKKFIDNGDGTITDPINKLMWIKPQVSERKSYNDVMEMLKDYEFAGYNDWRLPTMHELNLIYDESYANKSWYFDEYFEHDKLQPPILQHITSNLFADTFVWVTNFNFGYDGYYGEKSIPLAYRLVRNLSEDGKFEVPKSGQKEIYSAEGRIINFDEERSSYSIAEFDEYFKDLSTGIKYAKATSKSYTYEEAVERINRMNSENYGGINQWRMPTVDELRFIVDYSKKSPAVYAPLKEHVKADFYWTSEEYPKGDRNWVIYFGYGCAVPIERVHKCGLIAINGGYENLADRSMNRYEIQDEVVIDKYMNLMWLRDELPMMTQTEFENYLNGRELAGYNDWRMPDMKELSTLVKRNATNNEWFDKELFPHIYDEQRSFFIARESFNGCFTWGVNMIFAYDGYYANRLIGRYRTKAVRNI